MSDNNNRSSQRNRNRRNQRWGSKNNRRGPRREPRRGDQPETPAFDDAEGSDFIELPEDAIVDVELLSEELHTPRHGAHRPDAEGTPADEQQRERGGRRRNDRRNDRSRQDRDPAPRGDDRRRDLPADEQRRELREERQRNQQREPREDRRDERREDRRDQQPADEQRRDDRREDRRDERRDNRRQQEREPREDRRDDRREERREDRREQQPADEQRRELREERQRNQQREPREDRRDDRREERQRDQQPADEQRREERRDDRREDRRDNRRQQEREPREDRRDDRREERQREERNEERRDERRDNRRQQEREPREDKRDERQRDQQPADEQRRELREERQRGDERREDRRDNRRQQERGQGGRQQQPQVERALPRPLAEVEEFDLGTPVPIIDITVESAPEQPKPQRNADKALAPVLAAVAAKMSALYVPHGAHIILGVSGGVDSMAMLDMLTLLATEHGYQLHIAHFNHRLRGASSDADALHVKEAAHARGWDYYEASVDIRRYAESAKASIEEAARRARYRFFAEVASRIGAHTVVTAHTQDDIVETFFLNLFRGAGITGLSGIPERRHLSGDVFVVRPVCALRKADLQRWCTSRSVAWREDESNALALYTRNKVRNVLLPLIEKEFGEASTANVFRTTELLSLADETLSSLVYRYVDAAVVQRQASHMVIDMQALSVHDTFIRGEILQKAIQENFRIPPIPFDAIRRIDALRTAPVGTRCDVVRRLFALRDRDTIVIALALPMNVPTMRVERNKSYKFDFAEISIQEVENRNISFGVEPGVEYLDGTSLGNSLLLRPWKEGDVFRPLGMSQEVRVADFLTNAKVSLLQRQQVAVLCSGDEIVSICGIRIGDNYKVTRRAETVLRIEFRQRFRL